jgi:hypothetical protein
VILGEAAVTLTDGVVRAVAVEVVAEEVLPPHPKLASVQPNAIAETTCSARKWKKHNPRYPTEELDKFCIRPLISKGEELLGYCS